MKAILFFAVFAGLVATGSCTRKAAVEGGVETQSTSADSFSIKNHQAVTVEAYGAKIRVLLKDIINDSRCPSGAVCVWAGTVFAVLQVDGLGENIQLEIRKPKTVQVSQVVYVVELTDVSPYPAVGKTINPADYVATLKITRK